MNQDPGLNSEPETDDYGHFIDPVENGDSDLKHDFVITDLSVESGASIASTASM